MKKRSEGAPTDPDELRARILGLGERSGRKSYYPELRARVAELERFRAALDECHDAIFLTELPLDRLHDVNETACRMLGLPRSALLGQSLGDILPALRCYIERADGLACEHRESVSTTLRASEGGEIPVSASLSLVRVAGTTYAAAVVHDISAQKRADAEREMLLERERVARADAERASRLKDEFVATVSHELRTPLTAILGWASLARRSGASAERIAKALEVITRNVGLLAQIVDDLLDVSRIASGKLGLDVARMDLTPVVEAALEGQRAAAAAKGVALHAALEPGGAFVLGDAGRLEQVVSNLVSNAIKFTPQGGRVDLSLFRTTERVMLDVRDTGQGIPPEFLPYLFERFRQADASTSRRHGGLGLGLSIVKHVVELHHGTVRAENAEPVAGARFIVELPVDVAPGRAAARADGARWEPEDLGGTRVLVVEDDADAREFVQRILEEKKADVRAAVCAGGALEALEARSPDVLVCDIGLPGMDGYELMRQIRAGRVPLAASVPAVALTAFARPEDRDEALRAGFQEHLTKPVEPAALLAAVARLAGGARR